ncbi:fasciclin domain-containing protein [Dysgonomonas sp. 216]|uniref:fasciclin domain-containing protein n=1 Tax=Dysgonomonas sp. 216 TaxID=2302934 RepID=UPI0013D70748|nr:fasciclin domain-containing protein [Dysgonomonas sp. 216]NDW18958.1 fasciclin domain-containing protein [Dysgonomonas sp. 216]
MKKYNYIIIPILMVALQVFTACNDEWDDHYDNNAEVNGSDLLTTMKSYPQLSKFVKMVEISGLEKRLGGLDTYTVWAPDDDALAGVSLDNLTTEDSANIKSIVTNHIAYALYSTSPIEVQAARIPMVNGKYIAFDKHGAGNYTFGDISLLNNHVNKICTNGVLHIIDGRVPYLKNIWENIQSNNNLTMMFDYVNRFDSTYMDKNRSDFLGYDSDGNKLYDTVWVVQNNLLKKLGQLYSEDSIYTCIAPTNEAYQLKYEEYLSYFKSNGGPTGKLDADSVTDARANRAILNAMIYRKDYNTLLAQDSILSSGGFYFHNPANILNGEQVTTSNGTLLITDNLNLDIRNTYYKPRIYNPEYFSIDREEHYVELGNISTGFPSNEWASVINYGYVKISQMQSTLYPRYDIYFGENKVVSAKYDIYCRIVPAIAEDVSLVGEKALIDFALVYRSGTSLKTITLMTAHETDPENMETLLVGRGVELPSFDGKVGLRTSLNRRSKAPDYAGSFRIDCIYLIPSED